MNSGKSWITGQAEKLENTGLFKIKTHGGMKKEVPIDLQIVERRSPVIFLEKTQWGTMTDRKIGGRRQNEEVYLP